MAKQYNAIQYNEIERKISFGIQCKKVSYGKIQDKTIQYKFYVLSILAKKSNIYFHSFRQSKVQKQTLTCC